MQHGTKCTKPEDTTNPNSPGFKGQHEQATNVDIRKRIQRCYGAALHSDLAQVALHLLSTRPTSFAEWNSSLRGRAYTVTRNQLGLERAKKLKLFCFNSHAQHASVDTFDVFLSVVERIQCRI
jgi:hypothetical protein